MSHLCGLVKNAAFQVGPDSGDAATSVHTWEKAFFYEPAPSGTKLIILHFMNVVLSASNRLEVDLGYDTDVFTSADGGSFWTRPINVGVAGSSITIRYITNGASNGSASIDRYGRGESLQSVEPAYNSITNCNPFLINGWVEPNFPHISGSTAPKYEPFWICNRSAPPEWQNARCAAPGSVQRIIAQSVGMIVTVHQRDQNHPVDHVSTCSVTLIDSDLVVLAAHCITNHQFEIPTSSVTFDYEVQCDGSLAPGYNAVFYKVIRLVKYRYSDGRDYAVVQIKGVPPVPSVPIRISDLMPGENVFGVHHPNGAVKKISPSASSMQPINTFGTLDDAGIAGTMINVDLDVAGGSSGSGLFDASGNIVGVLAYGAQCSLNYSAMKTMMSDPIITPNPPAERAVVLVFDRSGSMSESAGGGKIKINEARAAASLFVSMVRTTGNRMGLVSFSNDATNPVDFGLANVTSASKNQLTNQLNATSPGGMTSIGDGLTSARNQLAGAPALPRSILLLTDGMENTPEMIANVTGLGPIAITAIGFGDESNLDGAKLSRLAQTHGGLYKRAGDGLELRKFYALAFGEIFEAGALADPTMHLPDTAHKGPDVPFHVCGEEAVTIVIGWDNENAPLRIELESPTGQIINFGAGGIEKQSSSSWAFARIPMPQNGERDGVWKARVFRPGGGGEFPPPPLPVNYFVSVIARGGPSLRPLSQPARLYTGDVLHPRVFLQFADETVPPGGAVSLTLRRPAKSVGTLIANKGLQAAQTVNGDVLPGRQATLKAIEQGTGAPVTGYIESSYTLSASGDDSGTYRAAGIFGKVLKDVLVVEGSYTFHAKATVAIGCTTARECQWSWHVSVGIDGDATPVTTEPVGAGSDGKDRIRVVFIPQDRYGNLVGPGASDDFEVAPLPGCTLVGGIVDHGDGRYSQEIDCDPDDPGVPGVTVGQPDRAPVVVAPQTSERVSYVYIAPLACGRVSGECCECTPLVPGRYATALSILNSSARPVKVALHVAPTTLAGATAGRWPDSVPFRAEDRIVLEPAMVTTIDCCSVATLLLGAEAPPDSATTYGLMLIESSLRLDVTATFTSVGAEGTPASIDVEQIEGRERRVRERVTAPEVPAKRPAPVQMNPPPRPQDVPRQEQDPQPAKTPPKRTRATKKEK
jgi:hypothetical protein